MTNKKQVNLHHGNCLDVLKKLPDNSIDSIVTDPPYGLSFMGKKWDYDVPSVDIWKECLRVLKPGGHLLAFAGTRTQHRMCVRIEDAGFEIRDMLAWVYGSGFPKSLDVSKAIDKLDATEARRERQLRFTAWIRETGLTSAMINQITGTNMGSHYTTEASQPSIATREFFEMLRPHFKIDVPAWIEEMVDQRTVESENFKKREVVGKNKNFGKASESTPNCANGEWDITTPSTDAAKKWSGWGTALKPALEPITLARKPLIGTVADNVLTHGTGALNIEGARIGEDERLNNSRGASVVTAGASVGGVQGGFNYKKTEPKQVLGRWPANFIHDGSQEIDDILGDSARFFYCAKTSVKDREEGLQSFEDKKASGLPMRAAGGERKGEGIDGTKTDRETKRKNNHPTVKPTDLMRYLCKLITPPGGVILDPFMGSGSTGKAAVLEGFKFTGIELDADYLKIAKARIEHATLENKNKKVPKNV